MTTHRISKLFDPPSIDFAFELLETDSLILSALVREGESETEFNIVYSFFAEYWFPTTDDPNNVFEEIFDADQYVIARATDMLDMFYFVITDEEWRVLNEIYFKRLDKMRGPLYYGSYV